MRQLLVTSALPYVNGHIHLGHLVEYIQTDMWVRFQRQRGHRAIYLCADDVHGTATMIRARQEGCTEADIIARMGAAHTADFAGFDIVFDHYGSTDAASNRTLVYDLWTHLRAARDTAGAPVVAEKDVTQLFDPQAGTFLADRFVKGTCPKCGAADQHGDSCDKCGATYSPADLKDPRSALTGAIPELRTARHCFVRLEPLRHHIEAWLDGRSTGSAPLTEAMTNWVRNTFLADGLRDWDVSRPAPYFGFEIPDAPGNYFYVWVDAPVGYLASLNDAIAKGLVPGPAERWWPRQGNTATTAEVHHFIGKDITYFHTLFWPAMLGVAGWKLPTKVHIHGFLTVNGEKMSKSKGTFVRGRTYLETIAEPAYLRYYYASKLADGADDLDLNLDEFVAKVNSDLVGKVVNLASRTAKFVGGSPLPDAAALLSDWRAANGAANERIAAAYEAGNFAAATREIMTLADLANRFVEERAPWTLNKDASRRAELELVCSAALTMFANIMAYLTPVLPSLAAKAAALLGRSLDTWAATTGDLAGATLQPYTHLIGRLEAAKVTAMIDASTVPDPAVTAPAAAPAVATATPVAPIAATISIDDFAKLDLRIATIVAAEDVPKAKKILKLTVDLGEGRTRTIFSGIKTAYADPAALVGRQIMVIANLAPRQMSFGLSEGMALAAGPGGSDIYLLSPDAGAQAGMRVQ